MRPIRLIGLLVAAVTCLSVTLQPVRAGDYPDHPIRIIVPFPPGGSADVVARMLGDHMAAAWKQPVVIENRPGGNLVVGTTAVAQSDPDGYTLLFGLPSLSTLKINLKNPPLDVEKDLAAISLLMYTPYVVAVNADLPAQNVAELIAYMKANPGKVNYSTNAPGQALVMEYFKRMAGVDMVRIPYQGEAQMLIGLAANDVQLTFASMVTIQPMVEAGKVRAIAVSTPNRVPGMLDVPTVMESGLPGFDTMAWFGILAPGKTPKDVQDKIAGEIARFVKLPEVAVRFKTFGFIPASTAPDEFARLISTEIQRWTEVADAAGIKPQGATVRMARTKIATLAEIEAAGRKLVAIDGVEVGVFLVGGQLHGWRNECPHQGGPVCQGRIFKRVIEPLDEVKQSAGRRHHDSDVNIVCPWHGIEFDLRTGQFAGNAQMALAAVPVETISGEVFVDV